MIAGLQWLNLLVSISGCLSESCEHIKIFSPLSGLELPPYKTAVRRKGHTKKAEITMLRKVASQIEVVIKFAFG